MVLGIDLGAAFSLATALGYDARCIAELLPAAEAGLIKALNGRLQAQQD
jgi:hypothetical protein